MCNPLFRRMRRGGMFFASLATTTALVGPATAAEPPEVPISDGKASLRVAFKGIEGDFAYRVTTVHEGTPLVSCPGNCEVKLSPGNYFVEVEPPAGSGWRPMEETFALRDDSVVTATPGRISPHGWGTALTVLGSVAIAGGASGIVLTQLSSGDKSDALLLASIGTAAAGGIALGAGIYLLASSGSQLELRPMQSARQLLPPPRTVNMTLRF